LIGAGLLISIGAIVWVIGVWSISDPIVVESGVYPAATGVAVADFDGDGSIDALLSYDGGFLLLQNDGNGAFGVLGEKFGSGCVDSGLSGGRGFAVGDLDGDVDMDLFVTYPENRVWINDGLGIFTAGSSAGNYQVEIPAEVVLGDFDSDGDLDAWVVNVYGEVSGAIFFNDGAGMFSIGDQEFFSDRKYLDIALGDLDGDTDIDAIAVRGDPGKYMEVWQNDGHGFFEVISETRLVLGGIRVVCIADCDGDLDLDALLIFAHKMVWWENDGGGYFRAVEPTLENSASHKSLIVSIIGDPK